MSSKCTLSRTKLLYFPNIFTEEHAPMLHIKNTRSYPNHLITISSSLQTNSFTKSCSIEINITGICEHIYKYKHNTAGICYLLFIREVIRVNPKSKVKSKPTAWYIHTQVDNPT